MFDRTIPFNDLPPLPPATEVETPAVLRKTIAASRALAEVYSKDLVEQIFRQPYCKIQFLERAGMGTRQTCAKYLRELERLGILHGQKVGREVYFIDQALFELLTH